MEYQSGATTQLRLLRATLRLAPPIYREPTWGDREFELLAAVAGIARVTMIVAKNASRNQVKPRAVMRPCQRKVVFC